MGTRSVKPIRKPWGPFRGYHHGLCANDTHDVIAWQRRRRWAEALYAGVAIALYPGLGLVLFLWTWLGR